MKELTYAEWPVSFDVYRSELDGALVIHIDTEEMDENSSGPTPLRVYVNDGDTVYANPDMPPR